MPLIRMEFDNTIVSNADAKALSIAVRDVVSRETAIDDVFVYANSAEIKIQIAPIEIFVEMSATKIADLDDLAQRIRQGISLWKQQTSFSHPINLTIIPMHWKVEVGI